MRTVPDKPSSKANSVLLMVAPPTVTSFEPRAKAVTISASEKSAAVAIETPDPVVVTWKRVAMSPVLELSKTTL